MSLLAAVPRLSMGYRPGVQDHLVRGAVCLALDVQISSKIASQFTFYQLCKDGGNLTKLYL